MTDGLNMANTSTKLPSRFHRKYVSLVNSIQKYTFCSSVIYTDVFIRTMSVVACPVLDTNRLQLLNGVM